jgi:N-dimethylarginine dimethylaminohydrolase
MKVLMCAPSHYTIRYEINPWMKIDNRVEPTHAQAQWEGLYRALEKLGARVSLIPQKDGCPDMVFTANAGVAQGKTFIPSHFRFEQRQLEEMAFIRYFRKKGYTIRDAAKKLFFEGEGDLLSFGDTLFGGFRYRSEMEALSRVSHALSKRVISLELSKPHFYHLDTCFLPLDKRSVLYYPDAFDRYGRQAIGHFVENPIPVSKEDAYRFACNGIRIGRTVLLNKASRSLKNKIGKAGYRVVEVPTSEFMKAGGSVKCLILKLS